MDDAFSITLVFVFESCFQISTPISCSRFFNFFTKEFATAHRSLRQQRRVPGEPSSANDYPRDQPNRRRPEQTGNIIKCWWRLRKWPNERVDDVSAARSIDLEQRTVSVQNKNMLASDDSFAYEQEEAVDCEPIKAPSKEYLLPEAAAASTSQHRQSPPPHRSRRLTNRSRSRRLDWTNSSTNKKIFKIKIPR